MRVRKGSPRRATRMSLLAAFGTALLGACAPSQPLSDDRVSELHQLRPPHEVERTVHQHLIPVNPTQTGIAEQTRRDLYDFLIGVGARPGDRVVLASREARFEQRGEVLEFLNRLGMRSELRTIKAKDPNAPDDGYDNAILVRYDLFVARNPNCGAWHNEDVTGFYNAPNPEFGCATTSSLQSMVAYPSSLVQGQPLDFPEGDVAAESVSRYRGRATEALQVESVGE